MSYHFTILIPTCQRSVLLGRTLSSMLDGPIPVALSEVVVVENGEPLGAKDIVDRFRGRLPVDYLYSEPANKSLALNAALERIRTDFVVFFDDDIRFSPETLTCYAHLPQILGGEFFAGGRCSVDYEEPPPEWLKSYLPPSAKGWGLGERLVGMTEPGAMGFNWCAFKQGILRLGGFNPDRGPGTASRGQETDMQMRLLADGVPGYYVPGAHVWHYVPRNRCSLEWALMRARQTAVYSGVELAKRHRVHQWRHLLKCRWRIVRSRRLLRGQQSPEIRFHLEHAIERNRGIIDGVASRQSRR